MAVVEEWFGRIDEGRPEIGEGFGEAVVEAVVKSLLGAGLPPKQIVVWDKHLSDLRQAGFFELAERYGDRFAPPALLVEKAEKGERFGDA